MYLEAIYERTATVGPGESDLFGMCRPSAVMDYLQMAATEHAGRLQVSRGDVIANYHCLWLLARLWYRLKRPIWRSEAVTVRTWPRTVIGASIYRDFALYVGQELVGEAVSVWVLADVQTRALLRADRVQQILDLPQQNLGQTRMLRRLSPPPDLQFKMERTVHYSDTDVNGHMNNMRYADVACDALGLETMDGVYPSQMQINFLQECRAGETLKVFGRWEQDTAFARGADGEGKPRFDVCIGFSPVPKQRENLP